MTRYILDTNSLGAFINHRDGVDLRAREAKRRGARIGTCVPVIGELFYGLELSASRDLNMSRAYAGIKRLVIWRSMSLPVRNTAESPQRCDAPAGRCNKSTFRSRPFPFRSGTAGS